MVVDTAGNTEVVATGLSWRGEVAALVFEEAAVDTGRALAAFTASRRGTRRGRKVGFPRYKRKHRTVASFRLRQKPGPGRAPIRVGDPVDGGGPRSIRLPRVGVGAGAGGHPPAAPDARRRSGEDTVRDRVLPG